MAAFEHPAPGGPEEDDRQGEDDRDEDPGQRGGVAHVEEREALTVQVEVVEEGRVARVAAAVADKPSAFATNKAIAAAKSKPVVVAEQGLPFDRIRSQN